MQRYLLLFGTSLLLLGLLLGTILDWFASPAVAADAHVAGVQHGMLIILLGLAWSYTNLGNKALLCTSMNILGLYGIWAAFLVGAVLGEPYPSASGITFFMFVLFSWILIAGISLFLYGLYRGTDT